LFSLPAILVLLALTVILFGAQASAAPDNPALTGKGVKIVSFAFQPSTVTIQHGQAVGWINKANIQHTTTSDTAGLWNSGPLNPGQHFIVIFPNPGTFTYHCSIHPFMKGTVVVQ
jgi:plastocyanin